MEFRELFKKALEVRKLYEQYEQKKFGKNWSNKDLALGFVGDVGDLVKLIQSKEGVRNVENCDQKLGHELADCLWSVLVLSDRYNINIESEFIRTMQELEAYLIKEIG